MLKTTDNTPYEKIGDEVRSLSDEIPFDIPDSWEWVRLGNIGDWGAGATPSRTHPEYYGGNIPWLKTGDLTDSYIDAIPETITELALEKTSVRLNPAGSVLIAMYGATIGKLGILSIAATTNQACCACFPLGGLDNKYLFYFLMAQKPLFIKQGEGGAQPNISKEKIVSTLMPVPPLEEQRRIVVMLGRIFPIIDAYSKCKTELDLYNTTFPERLKKSILQEAVKGKLVLQDPSDEPAEALLERIRAEKQRLIKEGKIKKDKHESVIFRRDNSHYEKLDGVERCIDNELPFEVPESWAWVYLGNISFVTKLAGFEYTKYIAPALTTHGIPLFKGKNIQNGKLIEHFEGFIPETISDELWRSQLSKRCLLTPYVGSIGNVAVFPGTYKAHLGSNVGKIEPYSDNEVLIEYILYFLRSATGYEQLTKHKKATAQESISIDAIRNVLMPIPPLNEQERIVCTINSALRIVQKL